MVDYLIVIPYYGGILFMLVLILKFSYELITRKKEKYRKSLRLIINFAILLFYCLAAFVSILIYVQLPSSEWILNRELKSAGGGLCVILFLAGVNYFYLVKIEKIKTPGPVIRLSIINCLILTLLISLIHLYYWDWQNSISLGIES